MNFVLILLVNEIKEIGEVVGVFPAADEFCAGIKSLAQPVAMAAEVVGHKVLVHRAVEPQHAVATSAAAGADLSDDKHPRVNCGA